MKKIERKRILASATYRPEALLRFVREKLGLKNDAALVAMLNFSAPEISRMRSRKMIICDSMLISMHEKTGIGTLELKKIAGMAGVES